MKKMVKKTQKEMRQHMVHVSKEHQPQKANPTMVTIAVIILLVLIVLAYALNVMVPFMGVAFLGLALLKMIDLQGFAMAYSQYDLLAMRSKVYAGAYPFIELALGIMFLFRWNVNLAAWITLILMIIGTAGVARSLTRKKKLYCACVGAFIKVPLTTFTLIEDISMGGMAAMILLGL